MTCCGGGLHAKLIGCWRHLHIYCEVMRVVLILNLNLSKNVDEGNSQNVELFL